MELTVRVPEALLRHGAVEKVELVGSRAAGTAVTLSDWDFLVATDDFDAVAQAISGGECSTVALSGSTEEAQFAPARR